MQRGETVDGNQITSKSRTEVERVVESTTLRISKPITPLLWIFSLSLLFFFVFVFLVYTSWHCIGKLIHLRLRIEWRTSRTPQECRERRGRGWKIYFSSLLFCSSLLLISLCFSFAFACSGTQVEHRCWYSHSQR